MTNVMPVVADLLESMNRNNIPICFLDAIMQRAREHIEKTTVPYFSRDDKRISFAISASTPKET